MDRALDEVFNQSGELNGYNLFSSHSALVDGELRARELIQRIALAVQAALLMAGAPAAFGTLPAATDHEALLRRCFTPAP